jgi:hypothetical protein
MKKLQISKRINNSNDSGIFSSTKKEEKAYQSRSLYPAKVNFRERGKQCILRWKFKGLSRQQT